MKLPHHDYAYCLCPELCGNQDTFWAKPRIVKQWCYKFVPTTFGEEVIKPCREDKELPEARLLWQENFDYEKPPTETLEEIQKDLQDNIDDRIIIVGISSSPKSINFQFYTICPVWYVKSKVNSKNGKKVDDLFANAINDLHEKYLLEVKGDKYRYRKDWWKKETLDLVAQTELLVKELKYNVFSPVEIAEQRNGIVNYLKIKHPDWKWQK